MFPNVNLAKATGVMFPNVNITMRLKWISQNKNVQPKQNVPPNRDGTPSFLSASSLK